MAERLEKIVWVLGVALALASAPSGWAQSPPAKTPSLIAVSTYDVGSSAYIQASAIADAMMKKYGIKTRVDSLGDRRIPHAHPENKNSELLFRRGGDVSFCRRRSP